MAEYTDRKVNTSSASNTISSGSSLTIEMKVKNELKVSFIKFNLLK